MSTAVSQKIPTQMYIDGSWCDALSGKRLAVINPADESVVAEVAYGSAAEAHRAIDAASKAFPAWHCSVGLRPRENLEKDRGVDAGPRRNDRPHAHPGTRQAARRGQGRGAGRGRYV